jgi:thiol-disulfide isomerase/thioredoxin
MVPDFQARTYDGKMLNFADLRGKYLLLDFWATWCGPCKEEMKHLADLHKSLAGDDRFVIISISLDDRIDEPAKYLQAHPYAWTQAFAGRLESSSAWRAFGIGGIPSLWIIGPDGKILARTDEIRNRYVLRRLEADGSVSDNDMTDEILDATVRQILAPRSL